jgi:hypothetical protein
MYWHRLKLPFKTDIVERLDWLVSPLNDTLVQRQKGINANDYQKNCLLLQLRMQIILLCFNNTRLAYSF